MQKLLQRSAAIAAAGLAAAAFAHDGPCIHGDVGCAPDAIASVTTQMDHLLTRALFTMMPEQDRAKIAAAGGVGSAPLAGEPGDAPGVLAVDWTEDAEYRSVAEFVAPETWARMLPVHRTMLAHMTARNRAGAPPVAACFAPGTPPDVIDAFNRVMFDPFHNDGSRFQQTGRWTRTATDGAGLTSGQNTTLTYSFVPDGTFAPNIIGVTGNSQLFQWLDGRYGSTSVWQDLFHQVFDRWEELIGTTYVYEPNDDGNTMNRTNAAGRGVLGVRGDVRIGAIRIDGSFNTLGYNNFPNDGDMVLDAFDSFFNSTSNNSRRLRNVIAHEHGHGLGMLHVCPQNNSKLMEPSASTSFDGPQLNDILNGLDHYGDNLESNNTAAEATDLGNFNAFDIVEITNVALHNTTDVDVFRVSSTSSVNYSINVAPDAATIVQGPQTIACTGGSSTNYNAMQDLRIEILDSDGTTVLRVEDSTGVEQTETLLFEPPAIGTYYIRIAGSGLNIVQRYQLAIIALDGFAGPNFVSVDAPTRLDPGVETPFAVVIDEGEDTIVPGSEVLSYRYNDSAFIDVPLVDNGDGNYTAVLPAAACGDTPEFFLAVEGEIDGVTFFPSGGAADPLGAIVGDESITVRLDDDFETDTGWVVSGDNTDGDWERAVPINAGIGDPSADADGSGFAYVTENSAVSSDVDGGSTILTSPAQDLSTGGRISYFYYINDIGSAPLGDGDGLFVEISEDGSSWTRVRSYTETSGLWRSDTIDILTGDGSATMQVRFIAADVNGGLNVVEAGVDGVLIEAVEANCVDPVDCPADRNDDDAVDFFDVSDFLADFAAQDPSADINGDDAWDFFDVSDFLALFALGCE